jgi:hypothetical protein
VTVSSGDAQLTASWILVKLAPDGATVYSAPETGTPIKHSASNPAQQNTRYIRAEKKETVMEQVPLFRITGHYPIYICIMGRVILP